MNDLHKKFLEGNTRTLSRLISMAENEEESLCLILSKLYEKIGHAKLLGVTGPPGAGKSSLINHFIRLLRSHSKRVGVISIDPVSPFTGGALLGDRIRLASHFNDPDVFIRSLSTRGRLGGLSLATREVTHLMDAFGMDYILIETVGVGQNEIDIHALADLVMLVLVPESGDTIQTMKAGVLEIADLLVVNKSEREGAQQLADELNKMLELRKSQEGVGVFLTSQENPDSIEKLFKHIESFFDESNEKIKTKRTFSQKMALHDLVSSYVRSEAKKWVSKKSKTSKNPYEAFLSFLKRFPRGNLFPE